MTKLDFKEHPLNGAILNSISNSLDHLSSSINMFYSMSIPQGFSEAKNLVNTHQELISVKRLLTELKEWTGKSTRTYRDALDDMNKVASLLPKPNIKDKNNSIK